MPGPQKNIHSDDFIFKSPNWMTRWGITVFAFLFILLTTLAYFIQYPDVVYARFELTSENPPTNIITNVDGKLQQLLVQENDKVHSGAILGVMQSETDWKEVILLDSLLNASENHNKLPNLVSLGTLQTFYSNYERSKTEYAFFKNNNFNERKIDNLNQQLNQLDAIITQIGQRKKMFEEEIRLHKKTFERNSELYKSGSISLSQFEAAQTSYNKEQQNLERIKREKLDAELRYSELQATYLNEQNFLLEKRKALEDNVRHERLVLKSKIDAWKSKHLLISERQGIVVFQRDISKEDYFTQGSNLFKIQSENNSADHLARAILPFAKAGKVDVNMPANLKIDGYPFREYGVIRTTIDRIAAIPQKDLGYEIYFKLESPLITNYDREISFKHEMTGTAEIITEKRSILKRLFERVRSALETHSS